MLVTSLRDPFAVHFDTFAGDVYTLDTASITLTAGTLTAEQITSTDDITMQGHLFTMGDAGAATDSVMSFLGSTNSTTIVFDESENRFDFQDTAISTTGNVTGGTIISTGNGVFADGVTVNNDETANVGLTLVGHPASPPAARRGGVTIWEGGASGGSATAGYQYVSDATGFFDWLMSFSDSAQSAGDDLGNFYIRFADGSFTAAAGAFDLDASGNITDVGSITSDATIQGATLTDGTMSITGGNLTTVGTIGASGDSDLLTLASGALTLLGTLTVGVDGTGHDVIFYGATAGRKFFWDESEDRLDCQVAQVRFQANGASVFEYPAAGGSLSGLIINDKYLSAAGGSRQAFSAWIEADGDAGYLAGFFGGYRDSGGSAPSITTAIGAQGNNFLDGTNARTITNLIAMYPLNEFGSSCNNLTVTNLFGHLIEVVDSSVGLTVDTYCALKIQEPVVGTTNWAILSDGGNSALGGDTSFGKVTAPSVVIDFSGEILGVGITPAGGVDAADVLDLTAANGITGAAGNVSGGGGATITTGDGGDGTKGADGGDAGDYFIILGTGGTGATAGADGVFRVGDVVTNYTQFEADGLQTMAGTARVLRSVDFEPDAVKKGGVGPADSDEDNFPIHDYDSTNDESVHIHWEIPHVYASAGEIHLHVEFFVDTAPASAKNVTWGVEYKKQSIGDNFDFGAGTTTVIVNTALATGTPANDKKIHSSAEIHLITTGFEPMDVVLIRIFRDADASEGGATDDFGSDARVFNYHLMYLSDKLGQGT